MNNFEHAERLAELTAMGTHELALMVIRLERDVDAYQLSDELQVALRQRGERDALQQLNAAMEREASLVAHVEQLSYVIVDAKRCAAVLAFPSNYNASDYQSFADAVMGNIETLSKQEPTNALTRRDLIKQAEALELVNCQSGPQEDTPQEDAFDAGWAAAFELIRQFASELRQRAQELTE
ncbi:hypothetical protein [Herbaspirillum sp.]|jgi:hypothetical protein|uniref:hypothetical protein n=1 Tax=Herbaspirillum sp. TaxID=1890675 RepID=UPI000C097708|nr:hypothetical protein [Herbaspirillum sp.]MAF06150.1 hypothetical protein [Herbaspirillum sp.]|tara:strand:+ start:3291 stop:3833 length:543 start_codon:yes stop_codon:yes gene_type:complete